MCIRDRRCSVRPGLTGMAQVYGRNGIPFYRRMCYDIVYARNVSLFMDARIVFQTVVRLLAHKDVRQLSLIHIFPTRGPNQLSSSGMRLFFPGLTKAVSKSFIFNNSI